MVTQEQLTIEGADRPGVTAPQHQIYSAIREVLRVRIVFCDPNRALDSFILGRGRSPHRIRRDIANGHDSELHVELGPSIS